MSLFPIGDDDNYIMSLITSALLYASNYDRVHVYMPLLSNYNDVTNCNVCNLILMQSVLFILTSHLY